MRKRSSCLLSAAAAVLMSACGGGGDDPQPASTYAVDAALGHLLVNGGAWTMNGTANGQPFVLTLTFAPAPSGAFPVNGAMSAQSVQTITVATGGATSSGAETIYFDAPSHAFLGLQADGACSVVTANTALPATAAVGAGGAIFSESDLDGCIGTSAVLGSTANNWSLVSDTGAVLLCWSLAAKDAAGTSNGSESLCVEIAADGTLGAKARFAVSGSGLTLSARNF